MAQLLFSPFWKAYYLFRSATDAHPGTYLFLRDPDLSNGPVDDVLAVMVTGQ